MYLEKQATTANNKGAYHYAGVMFPVEDLTNLASVIVGAYRDMMKGT